MSPSQRSEFDAPICPYCERAAVLVGGKVIYPNRPDLAAKRFWRCPHDPCDAYVGCHPLTTRALGRLANRELRNAKMAAHAWFDRRWNAEPNKAMRGKARRREYAWLAAQLGIAAEECHIGMMSLDRALRVVEVCRSADRVT